MKKFRYIVPNLITSMNLIFGVAAIVSAFSGHFETAFWMIVAAAVCDFCDGFAARLLHAYSEFGKQLDSLSDLISFGLAPAVLVFCYLKQQETGALPAWFVYHAFGLALFSAYRLARFNTRPPSDDFQGLAVPASALYVISLIVFGNRLPFGLPDIILRVPVIHIQILMINLLMISNLRMFSLKFRNLRIKENIIRYVFALSTIILLLIFSAAGLWLVMVFYIILSAATAITNKTKIPS